MLDKIDIRMLNDRFAHRKGYVMNRFYRRHRLIEIFEMKNLVLVLDRRIFHLITK